MVSNTFSRVVNCIAAATRYPIELLSPQADLENDLGIDSVKNLEVLLGLGEEFDLDLAAVPRDPAVRTIKNVASWIDGLLAERHLVPQHPVQPERVDAAAVAPRPHMSAEQAAPRAAADSRQAGLETSAAAANVSASTPAPRFGSAPVKSLGGRIALVTGSGRGVGSAIAKLLAARGAQVIVNSFHSREQGDQTTAEIIARGGKAVHIWGSVANPEHVERMFTQIEQQFGQLDILVCNASDGRIGSFMELTPKDWERAFCTNVSGHYQCAVRAARLMQSGGGSIVTMSAVGASRYIEGLGSQGVVKAAVEALTRYLACELGRYGIRVNCVAGGPVYGDLLSKFPAAQATQSHWESITADGQLCSPMDLANAIGFLVSEEARGINGSVWMVDHGFSAIADGRPLHFATPRPEYATSI